MDLQTHTTQFESLAVNLGMSPLQAKVLVSIFQVGGQVTAPQLVRTLSSSAKISRASIYNVLASLEDRGLLIVSHSLNKQKTYALPTMDPKRLLELIVAPQRNAQTKFLKLLESLQADKVRTIHQIGQFFTLRGMDSLLVQARILIRGAKTHLVMFSNLPFIKLVLGEILSFKENNPNASLFIQIIGNPIREVMKAEEKEYEEVRKKIGKDEVLPPVDFVSELQDQISYLLPKRIQILNKEVPLPSSEGSTSKVGLPEALFRGTAVAVMISDEGLLILWGNEQLSSLNLGVFSRDPFISQFLLLPILFVFRQNRGKPIASKKLERLLEGRIDLLVSVLDDLLGSNR